MAKFNAKEVAKFVASKEYTVFEYQAGAFVANHFGVTLKTGAKWVNRVIEQGLIKRSGKVAICLV